MSKKTNRPGRNEACPCGSGEKYKRCCGSVVRPHAGVEIPERAIAGFVDSDKKQVVFLTKDMLKNQLQRAGPRIAESFDSAFGDDIAALSEEFARSFATLAAGVKRASQQDDVLRRTCGTLLLNAAQTTVGALELVRHGFRLQPGTLVRTAIETICTALAVFAQPDLLKQHENGELLSSKTVTPAKKVVPILGHLYGFFSREFSHLGHLHRQMHSWDIFEPLDEAAVMNLRFVKMTLNLVTVSGELIFFDSVAGHRYWKRIDEGTYSYEPSEEEKKWQAAFLKMED